MLEEAAHAKQSTQRVKEEAALTFAMSFTRVANLDIPRPRGN
jgi:hypothetical protein